MDEVFAPLESEFVEENGEDLEVVVLLIAHNVYHLVDGVVAEAELGCADVLCHVDRCAIAAQEEFFVESLSVEVGPH